MALAQETRLRCNLHMEPGIERPQSALARGVQITEFKEARVNPEPVVIEETDLLLEQYLSPRKLMLLTGVDNLDDIKHLEMKVNTTDTSLGNFGQFLPNLGQLKVSNSVIPRVRDLGSSLRSLNVLWASRCSLMELDGISLMSNLHDLYLSYNEIDDVSPLSMLDHVQVLDLEGNNLEDFIQVQHLAICGNLTNLTLEGNPLCITAGAAAATDEDSSVDYEYRQAVKKAIPHLKYLDDELLIEGVGSFQKHNVFDADWAYLEELQKDIVLQENSDSDSSRPSSGNRPSTAALRPGTGYRPGSSLRPSSGFRPLTAKTRPASMGARPGTSVGMRPGSGSRRPASGGTVNTDASDLTMGRVICGNPSKALMTRRRLIPDALGELDSPAPEITFEPKFQHKAEHTYDVLPEEERDRTEIVDELKAWKQQHEKRMVQILEGRAPQVLRIDHDEADDDVSLSGDSDVESDEELRDEEVIHKVRDENRIHTDMEENRIHTDMEENRIHPDMEENWIHTDMEENRIHPDMEEKQIHTKDFYFSTFVPENIPTHLSKSNIHDADHVTSPYSNIRSSVSAKDASDSLLRASSTENNFRISDLKNKHKAFIPPPSQRDVVRKHLDTQSQAQSQSPLSSFLSQSPAPGSWNEVRGNGGLRVNSTGLPPPPSSGIPVISRNRREDIDRRSLTKDSATPLIRSTSYDRPAPPPSQRPSTARASLAIPAAQPKMRRSLPTVPSLPSKPMAPPK